MKRLIVFVAMLLFIAVFACKPKEAKEQETMLTSMIQAEESPRPDEDVPGREIADETKNKSYLPERIEGEEDVAIVTHTINKKKIIKDGKMSIEVEHVENAKGSIDAIVRNLNSYYENEELKNWESRTSYTLQIRIPTKNFELFVHALENGTGEIRSKSINARDVTEEFVDIEARLKNKKLYLEQYKKLLNKALKIDDIILVEENIRAIQEEIESKEGRLKYLSDQVEYSTLNLDVYKDKVNIVKVNKEDGFGFKFISSFKEGWNDVVSLFLVLIKNWFLVIVLSILAVFAKRFIKRRKIYRQKNELENK